MPSKAARGQVKIPHIGRAERGWMLEAMGLGRLKNANKENSISEIEGRAHLSPVK